MEEEGAIDGCEQTEWHENERRVPTEQSRFAENSVAGGGPAKYRLPAKFVNLMVQGRTEIDKSNYLWKSARQTLPDSERT